MPERVRRSSLRPPGACHAIVVSSSSFRSAKCAADPYLGKDGARLTAMLYAAGYTVHFLQNEAATSTQLNNVMESLSRNMQAADRCVLAIYAPCRMIGTDPYLLFHDAALRESNTWVPLCSLATSFSRFRSKNKFGFIFGIPVTSDLLLVSRTAQRGKAPSVEPKGKAGGLLHFLLPSGEFRSHVWPSCTLHPCVVSHKLLLALLGRGTVTPTTVKASHVLKAMQSSKNIPECDLSIMPNAMMLEKPTGNSLVLTTATFVMHFVLCSGMGESNAEMNGQGANFAMAACAQLADVVPHEVSLVPFIPGGVDEGEHWLITCKLEEACAVALKTLSKEKSIKLLRCWEAGGRSHLWFSSDVNVQKSINFPNISGPFFIGSVKIELPAESYYSLESTVRVMWPAGIPEHPDASKVVILSVSRYDISAKDFTASPPAVRIPEKAPVLPALSVSMHTSSAQRRMQITELGDNILKASWKGEEDGVSSSEEEEKPALMQTTTTNAHSPYLTPGYPMTREDTMLLASLSGGLFPEKQKEDAAFQPKQISPFYGERQPKLDFLKVGDKISLLSSEGLLCACWYGDRCFPVTESVFGGYKIPREFEKTVFQIERVTGVEEGPLEIGEIKEVAATLAIAYGQPIKLVNVLSSRYLCAVSNDAVESPHFLSLLNEGEIAGELAGDICLNFKIMPSSLLRSDGEKVRIGDNVEIVSLACNGCVMPKKYTENATVPIDTPKNLAGLLPVRKQETFERGRFMQNEDKSRWTINSYFLRPFEESSDDCMHTGQAVLLFHKELEGFLTADYELDQKHKPFVARDVRSCPRPGKAVSEAFLNDTGGVHKLYYDTNASPRESSTSYVVADFPHSSNALWLIEYIDPSRGGPVGWLQNRKAYRIRHIASSGYLTVDARDNAHKLTISSDPTNPHTVVVFHPVNTIQNSAEEAGMLITSSYCRIQFVHSRKWLHLDTENQDSILGFSSTTKVQPKLADEVAYEAVFAVRQASKIEFERLITICTMRASLGKTIHSWVTSSEKPNEGATLGSPLIGLPSPESLPIGKKKQCRVPVEPPSHDNTIVSNAIECLKSLIRFCTESSKNTFGAKAAMNHDKQCILFSQNIHLWVLKILQVPIQMDCNLENRLYTRLFQLSYQLLKNMIQDDVSLAVKLAPYIPFIESQLPCEYDAVKTLVGIYRNNYALLYKLKEQQLITYISPTPYLELLSCACICTVAPGGEEVGMQQNQNIIMEKLENTEGVVFPTRVHKGQLWIKPSTNWDKSPSRLLTRKPTADMSFSVHMDLEDIPHTSTFVKRDGFTDNEEEEEEEENSDEDAWSHDDGDLSYLRQDIREEDVASTPVSTPVLTDNRDTEGKRKKGWMPVKEFIVSQDDNQPYVKHFEGMLILWSMLCVDGDSNTRSKVSKMISFQEALTGIHMDFGTPECDNIRTAYATITRYLYVAAASDDSIKRSVSINTDEGVQFPRKGNERYVLCLKKVLLHIIKDNYVMVTECLARNVFLTEVLKLVQEMLKMSMYEAFEMKEMLTWLLRLLDPSSDVLDAINTTRAPYVDENMCNGASQSMWLNKILKRRSNTDPGHRQSFFGRKRQGVARPKAKMTVFTHNEVSMVVMNTKVEVCKLIMKIMDKEGEAGYDFRAWISEIRFGNKQGHDLLVNILLETTLYEGNSVLYRRSLETLYRAFSESLGCDTSDTLADIDDSSITAMANYVMSHLMDPKGPPDRKYSYVINLFRHLKEVPKGDDLCVVLLRTFTTVLNMAAEGNLMRGNGIPFTLTDCQNLLDDLGLTADIAVLIESRNSDVIKNGLECGIALLEGGNYQVQRSLALYFLSRDDEVLFKSLMDRIRDAISFMQSVESGSYLRGRRVSLKKAVALSPYTKPSRLQNTPPFLEHTRSTVDYTKTALYKTKNLFHTKEVMRYLQLFCEGHNTELQNYLREQGDNVHSFNLVNESLCFLTAVLQVAHIDEFMAEIALQTYNTLTEYCQGPVIENQLCVVHGGMCLAVNAVFQSPGDGGGVDFFLVQSTRPELVDQIRTAAVATVLSLLEGGTDQSIVAMMTGNQGLDLEVFRDTLYEVWDMKVLADAQGDNDKAEYALELGFSIFILFKTLQTYQPSLDYLIDTDGTRYFKERTGRIEICRGADVERVYFRIPELCVAPGLSERTKYELLWTVRRNTSTERIIDFFDKGDLLIYEVEYTDKWFTRDSTATMLSHIVRGKDLAKCLRTLYRLYGESCEMLMLYVAIFVNVLIVVEDWVEGNDTGLSGYIQLCAVLQLLLLWVCIGCFLTSEAPMLAYKRFKQASAKVSKADGELHKSPRRNIGCDADTASAPQTPNDSPKSNATTATSSTERSAEVAEVRQKSDKKASALLTPFDPVVQHTAAVLQTCLVTPSFYYYLTMIALAVLGYYRPLFLSVHLVSIARASDVLHNVIRAVTQNGKALLLTCVLGMVVVYLFSVVAYIFFRDALKSENGDPVCSTLIRCFSYALTHGVRSDGGLGDHMTDPGWSEHMYGMQMAFEVLFFLLVIVILLNIIFGMLTRGKKKRRKKKVSSLTLLRNCDLNDKLSKRTSAQSALYAGLKPRSLTGIRRNKSFLKEICTGTQTGSETTLRKTTTCGSTCSSCTTFG